MKDRHTITDIVEARNILGQRHKVEQAAHRLGIEPIERKATLRFYSDEQRVKIEAELDRIAAKKASPSSRS